MQCRPAPGCRPPASRTADGESARRSGTHRARRERRSRMPLSRSAARAARDRGGQIRGPSREVPAQRVRRDETTVEQRRNAGSKPPLPELCEHQRDIVVVTRETAADPQGLIERLARSGAERRCRREIETGIDVRFERKLAKQRQAERVDGRNGDVAEALLELAPARRHRAPTAGSLRAGGR